MLAQVKSRVRRPDDGSSDAHATMGRLRAQLPLFSDEKNVHCPHTCGTLDDVHDCHNNLGAHHRVNEKLRCACVACSSS